MLYSLVSKYKQTDNKLFYDIYNMVNKMIDDGKIENMIVSIRNKNEKYHIIYCQPYSKNINYEYLFQNYYKYPYDKSIINRLIEKFPEPEFKIRNFRQNYITHTYFCIDKSIVDNYIIVIDIINEQKCVIM